MFDIVSFANTIAKFNEFCIFANTIAKFNEFCIFAKSVNVLIHAEPLTGM